MRKSLQLYPHTPFFTPSRSSARKKKTPDTYPPFPCFRREMEVPPSKLLAGEHAPFCVRTEGVLALLLALQWQGLPMEGPFSLVEVIINNLFPFEPRP